MIKHRSNLAVSLVGLLLLSLVTGCGAPRRPSGYVLVKPTEIEPAGVDLPEDQLLDVGVAISDSRELSEKQMKKLGTNEDIRKSERHYLPYHLKNTLQASSHWGAVQVLPDSGVEE